MSNAFDFLVVVVRGFIIGKLFILLYIGIEGMEDCMDIIIPLEK